MMHASEECTTLIKTFEGFMAMPYICAGGYKTIGYGHVIRSDEDFSYGISRAQAENLLRCDMQHAERSVARFVPTPLSQGQYDALVSFTFNLGSGALQRSTLRRVITRGEIERAPKEFRRWIYAGGRKLRGLIRRREAEIVLFLS